MSAKAIIYLCGPEQDSQYQRLAAYAVYRSLDIICTVEENDAARPGRARALERLAAGDASRLIAAGLPNLADDVDDLLALVAAADAQHWAVVLADLSLDTGEPAGRPILAVLAAVARWQQSVISKRTKVALAQKKAAGLRLGRPVEVRAKIRARIIELREGGHTLAAVAARLNGEGYLTPRGCTWYASGVWRVERSARLDNDAATEDYRRR